MAKKSNRNPAGGQKAVKLGVGQPKGLARPSFASGARDSAAGLKGGPPAAKTRPGGPQSGGRPGGAPATVTRPGPNGA